MKNFNYFQPTEIRFGCGRINETGEVVARYGSRCLLVTMPAFPAFEPVLDKVKTSLDKAGVATAVFDGVIPNPTTESVSRGAEFARRHNADVILGLGGGSSMDTAKAIAVEASHEGTVWDYLLVNNNPPTEKTRPIIAVTTTSGTGSHVTKISVITNSAEKSKSAVNHPVIYPRVAIVDPELMLTVPKHVTDSTGFDTFTHAFEAYLHANTSPYIEMLAMEVFKKVVRFLPAASGEGGNLEARTAMAWADTLAGICISNAGVTLPHCMGMAIGGLYPHVMHGEALALTYPAFTRYTYKSAVEKFAKVGRIFNGELENESDPVAAERLCEELDTFMKEIDMWFGLEKMNIPEKDIPELAEACLVLPYYKNNPRVADLDDVTAILRESYRR